MTDLSMNSLRAGVLVLVLAPIGAGCGPSDETHAVDGTPRSSGIHGVIRLLPEFQATNARLEIDLTSVTPPERFGAGSHAFVVWDRRGARLVRLGALGLNAHDRTATFEAVTTAGPFDVLITAEPSPDVLVPSSQTLLVQRMSGIAR